MIAQPEENEFLSDSSGLVDQTGEADLWFLPGPVDVEPDYLPPLPRAGPNERDILEQWRLAQAAHTTRLAKVAMRMGALDDRLLRGPAGWCQRLALSEASDLGWIAGHRIAPDRLALWLSLRSGSLEGEEQGFNKMGWAFRRLVGGPGPDADLATFLGRQEANGNEIPLGERIDGWREMMTRAAGLHPIARGCFGFHLWPFAGIGLEGERLEAAVIAARIAAIDCRGGLIFAPLASGGATGLRAGGDPFKRLKYWLDGIETATNAVMRLLDQIEGWQRRAEATIADLSGKTPSRVIAALVEWPLVSAPMAEHLAQCSRAAAQRNLVLLQERGLLHEVTGQGRFRFWRCSL